MNVITRKNPPGSFKIGNKEIGLAKPSLIIGEVAQAHDGSLGLAHAYIDAIAAAGADAVKFQTHIASAETTLAEPWRVQFSPQDATRYAYWKRMEFSEAQWRGLRQHAGERRLIFLSSPFSVEAVDLLARVGVAAWKIPSGEVNDSILFERIASTGLPVLLSTGMSPLGEIDDAVTQVKRASSLLVVMQCASLYPSPPEKVGLNLLSEFRNRYNSLVGLSDHSGTIYAGLAAAAIGVEVIETHVTMSREMFGPDVSASITTSELAQLVQGVRFIERVMANSVDKDQSARDMAPLRRLFNKSIVASVDIPASTVLSRKHLALKKPGTGMPAAMLKDVLGRRLLRAVARDEIIGEEDMEAVK